MTDPDDVAPIITLAELHALKALQKETTPLPWYVLEESDVDARFTLLLINADPLQTIEWLYRKLDAENRRRRKEAR